MYLFLIGGVINRLFFLALKSFRRLPEVVIPIALLRLELLLLSDYQG
jgi:hypothetical protein